MSSKIFNRTESEERRYLEDIKNRLQHAIDETDSAVDEHAKDVRETAAYLWENKNGMDGMEKLAVRKSIAQIALIGENALAKKKRLAKLMRSPYFGRIDFREIQKKQPVPLYIGIHSFFDQEKNQNLIHDWRAPLSGMFYDFELGDAEYEAPSGRVNGMITLKRQYRIREGKMEFMLENALNIHDDVLQKELSRSSSEKMKNIVATIQRDQNAIIRNELSRTLIIQGVAGSGKTSIALHRIAFLLYRFKDKINSEDILIISPNKVFADYISNVLPELGEERIGETTMEELAQELLEGKYKFRTFSDQVSQLLQKDDEKYQAGIAFKSGFDFINKLNEFLVYIENEYFKPVDFRTTRYPVPATYLSEKFETYHRLPLLKRIPQIVNDIVSDMDFYYRYEVNAAERTQIRKTVESMFKTLNLRQIYKDFYVWLGKPEMLKQAKGSIYEYADVFPLIYLKINLEGMKSYQKVKHLVIDEMQDYTPVQYKALSMLFACNKTILGDINQSVNPFGSSDTEQLLKVFPGADTVRMVMSYRSTAEITAFAQKIRYNPELKIIDRHGEQPVIHYCKSDDDETAKIKSLMQSFTNSSFRSLGIICKTQRCAEKLYESLKGLHKRIFVLDTQSVSFFDGVTISSAHMAKGLEFDQVIVPFVNAGNYSTQTDKQMLYVAVTRAMHKLDLTFTHKPSALLPAG